MKKGCCLGCSFASLAVLVFCFGIGYLISSLDLFLLSPPVNTAEQVDGRPAVLLRVDTQGPEVFDMVYKGMAGTPAWALHRIMPYEWTLALEPRIEGETADVTLAISFRRLAGLLHARANPASIQLWEGLRNTSLSNAQEGVLVIRSEMPFQKAQPTDAPTGEPLQVPGKHAVEILVDNRDHRAEGIAAEMLPAYLPLERGDNPLTLIVEDFTAAIKALTTFTLAADFESPNLLAGTLEAMAADDATAEATLLRLLLLRDALARHLLPQELLLEATLWREGTVIRGKIRLQGVDKPVINAISRYFV